MSDSHQIFVDVDRDGRIEASGLRKTQEYEDWEGNGLASLDLGQNEPRFIHSFKGRRKNPPTSLSNTFAKGLVGFSQPASNGTPQCWRFFPLRGIDEFVQMVLRYSLEWQLMVLDLPLLWQESPSER